MKSLSALPLIFVLVAVLVAASTDVWCFRIHNVLTIPLCLFGLIYHSWVNGPSGLIHSIMGIILATIPFIALYQMGGMGAGDIKLMAGVGAWLGPWAILHVIIVSGLATGCYSAGLIAWKRLHPEFLRDRKTAPVDDVVAVLARPDRRWNAVPFGFMVAVGVIVTSIWIG